MATKRIDQLTAHPKSAVSPLVKSSVIVLRDAALASDNTRRATFGDVGLIGLNPEAFGAVGDGVTDDTTALQAAIDYADAHRARGGGDTPWPSRGLGVINVNGRYKIGSAGLTIAHGWGLYFNGINRQTSTFEFNSAAGTLFNVTSHIDLRFDGVGIINVAGPSGGSICFGLTGTGGGTEFYLDRCSVYGFGTGIKILGSTNNDSNFFNGCRFNNITTVMDVGSSTQAVVNVFRDCIFTTITGEIFKTAGGGETTLEYCQPIIDGTIFRIAAGANGTTNKLRLLNSKGEYVTTGPAILIGAGIANGNAVDLTVDGYTLAGGGAQPVGHQIISVDNGVTRFSIERSSVIGGVTIASNEAIGTLANNRYVCRIENNKRCPLPADITFGGTNNPRVVWRNNETCFDTELGGQRDLRSAKPSYIVWRHISDKLVNTGFQASPDVTFNLETTCILNSAIIYASAFSGAGATTFDFRVSGVSVGTWTSPASWIGAHRVDLGQAVSKTIEVVMARAGAQTTTGWITFEVIPVAA